MLGRIKTIKTPGDVRVLVLSMCYLTWQRGVKAADGIKVANLLTLRWCDYLGLSGSCQGDHKGPNNWKRKQVRETQSCGSVRNLSQLL